MSAYNGLHIFVAGASSRTGNAIARFLLDRGAGVFLNYRSDFSGVQKTLDDYPKGNAWPIQGDMSNEDEVKRCLQEIKKVSPQLNGLMNVFGEYDESPLMNTDFKTWKRILDNNLDSVFLTCKTFYPLLREAKYARVINFAYSNADRIVASRAPAYHIAKMGIISLSKTLAKEWGPDAISVNVISPGTLSNSIIKHSENPSDYIPQGRFGEYEDLWPVLEMVFRPDSAYLTGNNFVLSGGYNL